jgi:hypothetical protein
VSAPAGQVLDVQLQPLPELTPDEYTALRDDVAAHGVLVPIVVDQHGRLLDGHHRRRIADELGVDCPTEIRHVADDDEAHEIALTLNLTRRHLTRKQRRDLIRAEIERRPGDSDRAIARRCGASPSTVGAVRRGQVSNLDSRGTATDAQIRSLREATGDHVVLRLGIRRDPSAIVGDLTRWQRSYHRDGQAELAAVIQDRIDWLLDRAPRVLRLVADIRDGWLDLTNADTYDPEFAYYVENISADELDEYPMTPHEMRLVAREMGHPCVVEQYRGMIMVGRRPLLDGDGRPVR